MWGCEDRSTRDRQVARIRRTSAVLVDSPPCLPPLPASNPQYFYHAQETDGHRFAFVTLVERFDPLFGIL